MKVIRGLYNQTPNHRGCVATIGNFDGVHPGHLALFNQLNTLALNYRLPSLAISFQPLPHEYFSPEAASTRIQTFRDRVDSLASTGLQNLLLLRFDEALATQSATAFVTDTLVGKLGVKHLLVGDDFRFGAGRQGNMALLKALSADGSFTVSDTDTVKSDALRVSSTRIRQLLEHNDCDAVNQLLGRPHRISGRVVHGEKIGRTLGFPTANIALKNHRPLLRGVFAVMARNKRGDAWPAVANLGERPTVNGRQLLLEVHMLDTTVDLYGQHLSIDFHHFVRGEMKFDSLDALKQAITDDAETARRYFADKPSIAASKPDSFTLQ